MKKDLERLDKLLTEYVEWPPEWFDGAKEKWRSIELELIKIVNKRKELLKDKE